MEGPRRQLPRAPVPHRRPLVPEPGTGTEDSPRIIDAVKIQITSIGPRRLEARVLRVLEYNGQVLGEPLDGNALEAILGSFNKPPLDEDGDLFRK